MNEISSNGTASAVCADIADGATLLELGKAWLKQGNPAVAAELFESAMRSPAAGDSVRLRAQVLKEIGRAKMMESDWAQAEAYHLQAQRLFADMRDTKGAAECARNRANALFQAGKFIQAEELCRQALDWASSAKDYELRATIFNTIGAITSVQGRNREAVTTFRLCLADFQTSGNVIRQGYVLLNIGLSETELGHHAQAHDALNQALNIALREQDQHLVEICYQNIAKCYLAQHEAQLAKSVVDSARRILPGLNSRALELELEFIEARIARALGDLDSAGRMLRDALPAACEAKLTSLAADLLLEQARLAAESGDVKLAVQRARRAQEQYRIIGATRGEAEATVFLTEMGEPVLAH